MVRVGVGVSSRNEFSGATIPTRIRIYTTNTKFGLIGGTSVNLDLWGTHVLQPAISDGYNAIVELDGLVRGIVVLLDTADGALKAAFLGTVYEPQENDTTFFRARWIPPDFDPQVKKTVPGRWTVMMAGSRGGNSIPPLFAQDNTKYDEAERLASLPDKTALDPFVWYWGKGRVEAAPWVPQIDWPKWEWPKWEWPDPFEDVKDLLMLAAIAVVAIILIAVVAMRG
jgi:hypothetical protein